MALAEKVLPQFFNPIRLIEWIIAVCTFATGIYVFTPLYDISTAAHGPGAIAQIAANPYTVVVYGLLLIVGAVLVMVGSKWKKPRIRSSGWFILIVVRFFQLLATFVVIGFLPISWIHPFTLLLIYLVLWGLARIEVHGYGT